VAGHLFYLLAADGVVLTWCNFKGTNSSIFKYLAIAVNYTSTFVKH
jgi:hypothetical protein